MHEPTVRAEPPLTATSTFPRELTATVDTDSSTKTASTSTTSSQDALPLADVGKRHSAPGDVAESCVAEEMSTTVRQSHAVV